MTLFSWSDCSLSSSSSSKSSIDTVGAGVGGSVGDGVAGGVGAGVGSGVKGGWAKATGSVPQPEGPFNAISTLPSPLMSPATSCAPPWDDHCGKLARGLFVTVNDPSPLPKAVGNVPQPEFPHAAKSPFPSPSKSPATRFTPDSEDQDAKLLIAVLVTRKLPSPLENATGTVPHPTGPLSAASSLPSPSKSAATSCAPDTDAQLAKLV